MSKTLNEHWPYNPAEPGYLRTRPTPHSSSNSLRKSLPHTDPGPVCFSLPPYQGSEVLRAASSFKRTMESRTLRSAVTAADSTVLSAAFLFVVFVVVGPSDLSLCLTGALHYKPATCDCSTTIFHGVCDTCEVDRFSRSATLRRNIY